MLFDGHRLVPFELLKSPSLVVSKKEVVDTLFGYKLQTFSFTDNTWNDLHVVNTLLFTNQWTHYTYTLTSQFLYLSGVDPIFRNTNVMYKLDVVNFIHIQLPVMNTRRIAESIIVVGDTIYVIGGRDDQALNTNEYYDGNRWVTFKSLNHPRYSHKSIVHNGQIYVFGEWIIMVIINYL